MDGSRGGAGIAEEAQRPLDEITGAIVDSALKIHREIGPGLLVSVYEIILARDLARRGFRVERQVPVTFEFDGLRFDNALRIDLFVDRRVIVEIKSIDRLAPVHSKQVLTYLRLMKLPVGLLVNFDGETLREGLARIVNKLDTSAASRLRVNQRLSNSAPR
ncbi:MAG TPA: GxxExxY protein [Rhizomicrobium sp.]|jgi:iron complex transport system substrate-binding protein|nr:GxxExxY protein [Rhizomicrobium sp.]